MAVEQRYQQAWRGLPGERAAEMRLPGPLLEFLTDARREQVDRLKGDRPLATLEREIAARGDRRPFSEALVQEGTSVIAEFKRRSPTRGELARAPDLPATVQAYEQGGAAALSILAEEQHFGGVPRRGNSQGDAALARAASSLPILYKDFVSDPYQLYLAAAEGADAVLLIVGILDDAGLKSLYHEARAVDLDCLVEVHDKEQLQRALDVGADVIGINNRQSFKQPSFEELVDIEITLQLISDVPTGKTVVSESGISTRGDIERLEGEGVDAFLVGTRLMQADDPEGVIRELTLDEKATREHYIERAAQE